MATKAKPKKIRKSSTSKVVRNAKTGLFISLDQARVKPNTTLIENIQRPITVGRSTKTLKGEPLPSRDPKTGSFTTKKSTVAIRSNIFIFSSALERLAKK